MKILRSKRGQTSENILQPHYVTSFHEPKKLYAGKTIVYWDLGMFVCHTCKGTALILAVENDGRLCFEECPDCNPHPESYVPVFEKK
jgi:hypothetical protein